LRFIATTLFASGPRLFPVRRLFHVALRAAGSLSTGYTLFILVTQFCALLWPSRARVLIDSAICISSACELTFNSLSSTWLVRQPLFYSRMVCFGGTLNETLRESAISIFAVRCEAQARLVVRLREFHLLLLRASFTYHENKVAHSLWLFKSQSLAFIVSSVVESRVNGIKPPRSISIYLWCSKASSWSNDSVASSSLVQEKMGRIEGGERERISHKWRLFHDALYLQSRFNDNFVTKESSSLRKRENEFRQVFSFCSPSISTSNPKISMLNAFEFVAAKPKSRNISNRCILSTLFM